MFVVLSASCVCFSLVVLHFGGDGLTKASSRYLILSEQLKLPTIDLFEVKNNRRPQSNTVDGSQVPTRIRPTVPLPELVNTFPEVTCPEGLYLVTDKVIVPDNIGKNGSNETTALSMPRRIPKSIHVTSRSRCVPKVFYDNLQKWRNLDGYSFYFHNEQAVDRLLEQHWEEFPHLRQAVQCHRSGAGKADIWRAVLLFEYGGVYTDIDNTPVAFNGTTISPEDEAFFVIEVGKYLSQYFFASAPHHPLLFFTVQQTLLRLLALNDINRQYVPFTTGPRPLKFAFQHFMNEQGPNNDELGGGGGGDVGGTNIGGGNNEREKKKSPTPNWVSKFHRVHEPGVYRGIGNWTVTVVKGRDNASTRPYVARNVVPAKYKIYRDEMNMTHFSKMRQTKKRGRVDDDYASCIQRIYLNDPSTEMFRKDR